MARNYPRYLFSDPQNTKSKGPFIVHLLDPRIIVKIGFFDNTTPNIWHRNHLGFRYFVLNADEFQHMSIEICLDHMIEWFRHQPEYSYMQNML